MQRGWMVVSALAGLLLAAGPGAACEIYEKMEAEAAKNLRQFDRLVVAPLERERAQFEEELDREVNGPVRRREAIAKLRERATGLERQAAALEETVTNVQGRLEAREREIEELEDLLAQARDGRDRKRAQQLADQLKEKRDQRADLRQRLREKTRELAAAQAGLEEAAAAIARQEAAIEAITTQPPTREDLEAAVAASRAKLKDLRRLQREQEEKARFLGDALALCRDHQGLEAYLQGYREAVIKLGAYGCTASVGEGAAARQARQDFNCR